MSDLDGWDETLEYLNALRDMYQKQLDDVELKIQSHPETIRNIFYMVKDSDDFLLTLLSKVQYVNDVSGTTHSRKNQMNYSGFAFSFDNKVHRIVWGSNWCHSFENIDGNIGTSEDNFSAFNIIDSAPDDDDSDVWNNYLLQCYTDGDLEDYEVIAVLLRLTDY